MFKDKPGGEVVDYLRLADELKPALATYTESGVGDQLVRSRDPGDGSESRTSLVIGRDGRRYPATCPECKASRTRQGSLDKSRAGVQARRR